MSEVVLNLGGESFRLRCTLDAFRTIPANLGGFVGAFGALSSADVNTCAFIIAAATGKAADFKEHERIAGKMFEQGLEKELFDKLTEYVRLLQNGGKVKTSEEPNGTAGE
jgi:hypothetical protein